MRLQPVLPCAACPCDAHASKQRKQAAIEHGMWSCILHCMMTCAQPGNPWVYHRLVCSLGHVHISMPGLNSSALSLPAPFMYLCMKAPSKMHSNMSTRQVLVKMERPLSMHGVKILRGPPPPPGPCPSFPTVSPNCLYFRHMH